MKSLMKESFFPKNKLIIIAYLLIVSIPIIRILASIWVNGFEGFDVLAIYRSNVGDIQYFQAIEAVSKFNIREVNIFENLGHGVQGFPIMSLLIYSVLFKIFGAIGFVIADIFIYYTFFCLLILLFRIIGAGRFLSLIIALIVCSSLIENIVMFVLPEHFQWSFRLWGMRIPRPFVTELFIVSTMCLNIYFIKSKVESKILFFLTGISIAILTNMDLFAGFQFILIQMFILFVNIKSFDFKTLSKRVFWSVFGFFLFILPFLIQQSYLTNEISTRNGIIALTSLNQALHLIIDIKSYLFVEIIMIISFFIIVYFLNYKIFRSDENRRVYIYLSILLLISVFSAFLFSIITGKVVHPHQNIDRLDRYLTYSVLFILVFIMIFIQKANKFVNENTAIISKRESANILILILVVCFVKIGFSAKKNAFYSEHLTPANFKIDNYRKNFAKLVVELKRINSNKPLVLGTFDHQVRVYWQTFCHQYSYLPDMFCSTIPDTIVDNRFVNFTKILGIDSANFNRLIEKPSTIVFALPGFKYIANSSYQYSSICDYTKDEIKQIQQTNVFDINIVLPISYKYKLTDNYIKSGSVPVGELDYIVLQKDDVLDSIRKIEGAELIYKNDVFRLYKMLK